MMKRLFILFAEVLAFCMFIVGCHSNQETGKRYVGWKPGEMEIHHIYTGRGESNFMIFPDGTTMLVDAGDWDPKDYSKMCVLLPDSSRRAGTWIARYIERVNPYKDHVDYLMISHFHNDHTGDCTNETLSTKGRNPDYVLTGIAGVGETIRFRKVFDRGYPDYQYPLPIQDPDVNNYRAFVKWQNERFGLEQVRFDVGKRDQIILLKDPDRYGNLFSIQNLSANGEIWTGKGKETIRYYDLNSENLVRYQNENTKSLGIRISYGPFRYYAGGDLSGSLLDSVGQSVNLEEKIAEACGQVDVCKANHHAYLDAMTEEFIRNIKAKHYVIPVWDYEHIQPSIMSRMVSDKLCLGNKVVFPTNFPEILQKKYIVEDWMKSVCREDGHVVVKVYDKGQSYKIYVLSAADENMLVKAVYGPYKSGNR